MTYMLQFMDIKTRQVHTVCKHLPECAQTTFLVMRLQHTLIAQMHACTDNPTHRETQTEVKHSMRMQISLSQYTQNPLSHT